MINIKSFRSEWDKIKSLLDEIALLPKLEEVGNDFIGVDIDENGITYKTSTWYSGIESFLKNLKNNLNNDF